MAIKLAKGANLELSRNLNEALIGLGWNPSKTPGVPFDLDAWAIMLTEQGKVRGDDDVVFYNQTSSPCNSITHGGDNRDGEGDGDDEFIRIDLQKVPTEIARIAIVVSIHDAGDNGQNFSQVDGAFVRCVDFTTAEEITRYELNEKFGNETACIFAEIKRSGATWKFHAIGQALKNGLAEACALYGVDAE